MCYQLHQLNNLGVTTSKFQISTNIIIWLNFEGLNSAQQSITSTFKPRIMKWDIYNIIFSIDINRSFSGMEQTQVINACLLYQDQNVYIDQQRKL